MNRKIYIVLLIALLTRSVGIFNPVLGWHSWRQSDTAEITRNFYENGHNILYPQINWGGAGTGYVESEFHIYPFIVSLLYSAFGEHDMFGRMASVLFSILTVFGLYLLVRKLINEDTAIWSAFIYAILPLNIFYGRAFMPESMMLMCTVYSLYFFSEWLDKEEKKYFILAWIFTALAILIKLPAVYIGLPLFYLAFQKYRYGLIKKYSLYILTILIFIPVVLWYYHAHQLLLNGGSSFGIWSYGVDKWGMFSLLTDPAWYNDIFFKSIAERHLTYPGFILLAIGLFLKRKYDREKLFDTWLIAVIIFIFIAAQAHRAQEYYSLPFDIPAAVFIGKIFAKYLPVGSFKNSFKMHRFASIGLVVCLMLICILSYLRMARFLNGENPDSVVLKIGNDVRSMTSPNDKIITVSNGNPVYLYHSHRKGWTGLPQALDSNYIEKRKTEGAKWIAGEKEIFEKEDSMNKLENLLNRYKVIKNEKDYFIVKLE